MEYGPTHHMITYFRLVSQFMTNTIDGGYDDVVIIYRLIFISMCQEKYDST